MEEADPNHVPKALNREQLAAMIGLPFVAALVILMGFGLRAMCVLQS